MAAEALAPTWRSAPSQHVKIFLVPTAAGHGRIIVTKTWMKFKLVEDVKEKNTYSLYLNC
jgi:hypothetical protein